MPKYQIILESNEILADDEFEKWAYLLIGTSFKLVEARNLEGIREELWKKKDELEGSLSAPEGSYAEQMIEESFNEIKELFKL